MARYKGLRGFLTDRVVAFEKRCIIRIMRKAQGSVTKAAKLAQRNRTEFYRLLNFHQIKPSEFRQSRSEVDTEMAQLD